MTPIEAAEAEVSRLRAKFASYDGGDRPMSPPVSLMRELNAAEERLRQLRAETSRPADMSLETITARHERARADGVGTAERQAHADRGELLRIVAEMSTELGRFRQAAPEKIAPILDRFAEKVGIVGPMASRVFEPTTAEVNACPVLAEMAGKPEREAVLELGRRLQVMREERARWDEASDAKTRAWQEALDRAKPTRPRIGPWVRMAAGSLGRFDERGHQAAHVDPNTDAPLWWASRALNEEASGRAWDGGEDAARAAADAVLREWADIDGEATHCTCPSPKDIMYGGNKGVCEHCGLDTAQPPQRTWTEQQIFEAWCRAEETGRPEWMPKRSTSVLENEWAHVRAALRGDAP